MKKIFILIFILSITSLDANEYIDKAFVSFQNKDYNSAITQLKSCEGVILNGSSDEDIIKYYYGVGRSYLELDEIDSAFKYQLISYNLKKSLRIEENLNLSLNDLGIIYNKIGLPHKSIFFLNNAIILNKKLGKKNLLYYNYLNLGVTYNDLNFKDSTKKYYLLAKELSYTVDELGKSKLYNNLAVLYQDYGDFEKAIKYSKNAINTNDQNQLESLKWLTNLELTYLYQGAEPTDNNILDYYEKATNRDAQYYISDALFKLSLFNISNNELSFAYIKESIDGFNKLKNYVGALSVLREYKKLSESKGIVNPELLTIENQLLVANTNRIAQEYGNEMRINQESEVLINNLQKEIYYANIGFYGLLFIILFLISFIAITIYAIRKYNLVNKFIELIRNTNNHNLEGTNNAKSDLGKLTYMLDQRLKYKGNEQVYSTLDNIINNVNNIDTTFISSSNKEAEIQLLTREKIAE
ncbi:MAG: hypothetical protein WC121_05200 [Candidatus Kapaibacterium sp.]